MDRLASVGGRSKSRGDGTQQHWIRDLVRQGRTTTCDFALLPSATRPWHAVSVSLRVDQAQPRPRLLRGDSPRWMDCSNARHLLRRMTVRGSRDACDALPMFCNVLRGLGLKTVNGSLELVRCDRSEVRTMSIKGFFSRAVTRSKRGHVCRSDGRRPGGGAVGATWRRSARLAGTKRAGAGVVAESMLVAAVVSSTLVATA